MDATREIDIVAKKLQVGPVLKKKKPQFRPEDRICGVARGIFSGETLTATKGPGKSNTSTSSGTSRPQQLRFDSQLEPNLEQNVEAKSSPLYFGSYSAVVESDHNNMKYWKRAEPDTSVDAADVKWFPSNTKAYNKQVVDNCQLPNARH